MVILICRSLISPKLRIYVLAVDGEFAGFVSLMECLRHDIQEGEVIDVVLVLSKWKHETLDMLYESATKSKIIRGGVVTKYVQQALLMQPQCLVTVTERASSNFLLSEVEYADSVMELPPSLLALRDSLFQELKLANDEYVLMSVYTMDYERERNPRFLETVRLLETHGDDLVEGIDFVRSQNLGVVMVGSPDTGRSRVLREFPRLAEFGKLGGPQEVALASGCQYFWTDNVGAWWLIAPFQKPVLHTNFHHKTPPHPTAGRDLYLPRRYMTPEGKTLSLREMLYMEGSPNKAALRGELVMIRNSPAEIVEAHQEMMARIDGSWIETPSMRARHNHVVKLYSNYRAQPLHPMRIAASFLERHEELLR